MARRNPGQKRRDPNPSTAFGGIDGEAQVDDMAIAAAYATAVYTATALTDPACDGDEIDLSGAESEDPSDVQRNADHPAPENGEPEEASDSDESDVDLAKERALIERMEVKDANTSVAPKTEHELDAYQTPLPELEKRFQFMLRVDEQEVFTKMANNHANLSIAGNVKSHLVQDRTIIVESSPRTLNGSVDLLDEGSLLGFLMEEGSDEKPQNGQRQTLVLLGRVFEIFGPVRRPLYTIRLPPPPKKKEPKNDSRRKKTASAVAAREGGIKESEPNNSIPENQKVLVETQGETDTPMESGSQVSNETLTITALSCVPTPSEENSRTETCAIEDPLNTQSKEVESRLLVNESNGAVVETQNDTGVDDPLIKQSSESFAADDALLSPVEVTHNQASLAEINPNSDSDAVLDGECGAKIDDMIIDAVEAPIGTSSEGIEDSKLKPCSNGQVHGHTADASKESLEDQVAGLPASEDVDPWSQDGKYTKFLSSHPELPMYYAQDEAKIIDSQSILRMSAKGCDASNVYDEEVVNVHEMYFSDDEKERELKGKHKNRKTESETAIGNNQPNTPDGGSESGRGGRHFQSAPLPAGFHRHQPHPQPQVFQQAYHNPRYQQPFPYPHPQMAAYGVGIAPPAPPHTNQYPYYGQSPAGYNMTPQFYGAHAGQPYIQHHPTAYAPYHQPHQQPVLYHPHYAPAVPGPLPPPPPPPPPPPAIQHGTEPAPEQQRQLQSDTIYFD